MTRFTRLRIPLAKNVPLSQCSQRTMVRIREQEFSSYLHIYPIWSSTPSAKDQLQLKRMSPIVPSPSKRFPRCLSTEIDTIHFFTKSRSELTANIDNFIDRIKQDGMIWVSWPKKSAKVPTDVTEDVIREVILPRGLVDVMVCAIDEVWSGLKLVFRKENRV